MALVADNVVVGLTGGVYFGPIGTSLPTDTAAALGVALLEVGYLTEAGVTQSEGESSTKIKAWQNADVVRILQTEHSLTYQFVMQETNPNSLALLYGANYAAGMVSIKAGSSAHHAFVIEVVDGDSHVRIAIADGQITERGDIVYVNGDAVSYPVTVECFPDVSGVKALVYYETATVSA
jgi:hypothetical protein